MNSNHVQRLYRTDDLSEKVILGISELDTDYIKL